MPPLITPLGRVGLTRAKREPFTPLRASDVAGANTGTTLSIAAPAGVKNGDLLVTCLGSGNVTVTGAPPGWTLAHERLATDYTRIFWKIAAGEPASWTWTFSGSSAMQGIVLVYEGDAGIAVDDVSDAASVGGTTVTLPSISLDTDRSLLVVMAGQGGGRDLSVPAGMTQRAKTNSLPGNFSMTVCDQYLMATGATGTRVLTGGSLLCSGILVGFKR